MTASIEPAQISAEDQDYWSLYADLLTVAEYIAEGKSFEERRWRALRALQSRDEIVAALKLVRMR